MVVVLIGGMPQQGKGVTFLTALQQVPQSIERIVHRTPTHSTTKGEVSTIDVAFGSYENRVLENLKSASSILASMRNPHRCSDTTGIGMTLAGHKMLSLVDTAQGMGMKRNVGADAGAM